LLRQIAGSQLALAFKPPDNIPAKVLISPAGKTEKAEGVSILNQ
jgi:hypothetical protein